jgi:hypothetical protein
VSFSGRGSRCTEGRCVKRDGQVLLWARSPVHRLPACEENCLRLSAGHSLRMEGAHQKERMEGAQHGRN